MVVMSCEGICKKLSLISKYFIYLIFVSLFLWICHSSFLKFKVGRKSSELRRIEVKNLQYPSVSVCVENTVKIYENFLTDEFTFEQTKSLIKENVWKRNETFFFVNQPSAKTKGYPCMTTKDSSDPGKPCNFPFISDYRSLESNSCVKHQKKDLGKSQNHTLSLTIEISILAKFQYGSKPKHKLKDIQEIYE